MELYTDIEGTNGDYYISNYGNVISLKQSNPKQLKKCLGGNGYYDVKLRVDNKTKTYYIHHLVASHFLNHRPSGYNKIIDHIDGDKLNNNLQNLQIVTNSYNTKKGNSCKNKYLPKGVIERPNGKYQSYYWCKKQKKNITIGTFDTVKDAENSIKL